MDLLGEHLPQRAPEHGEVLGEQEDLATVDRAPTGDDTVRVGAFGDARFVGPVTGQHVELVERSLVEQVVDALAGQHLALVVLSLYRPLGPGVYGLVASPLEIGDPFGHRVLGHCDEASRAALT